MARRSSKKPAPGTSVTGKPPVLTGRPHLQSLTVTGIYFILASMLTFPLIFRMGSSIYGPYDHISTDLFANINVYFWWLKEALFHLKSSPFTNPLLAAPFSTKLAFVNLTGFLHLPITLVFGPVFSRNVAILFNLVVSGLGMFFLVRHITKSAGAGFIAGIVFAFCPNMLVRSYTTYDSTQVQWISLYTLYVIKFIEKRTWRNIIIACVFLVCHILVSFPYYLVYLPVHTLVLLVSYSVWHIRHERIGIAAFFKKLSRRSALDAWLKVAGVLAVTLVIFVLFYATVIGGRSTMESFKRTTAQLEQLALTPADYLVVHPSSALLKGDVKTWYWDEVRPGKDPNSFVAYIGYVALLLTIVGIVKGRGAAKWFFLVGALVAFWSTLGPKLFGLPTPSGLIYSLYAPFARRILIYKVFVQMSVAGLAGLGVATILQFLKKTDTMVFFLVVVAALMVAEYSLVPPVLSVDLTENPELYERIRELPEESILMEVPVLRNNGLPYQGYLYYQTVHGKRLFNPHLGVSGVPEPLKPFYRQMTVPIEACEYCNLAAMRYLGVTHLTYHWEVGTKTVAFRSFVAPRLYNGDVEGLSPLYRCDLGPRKDTFTSPYDYTFADLYEITAEPSPIALIFDYHSPYEPVPGVLEEDGMAQFGWISALLDTTATFYYPLPNSEKVDRILRQGGQVTAVNLSDDPVDFSVSFQAESPDSGRVIEVKWNDGPVIGSFEIGPNAPRCTVGALHLDGGESGTLGIWCTREKYAYNLGGGRIPASAVLRDFRVTAP